MAAAGLVAALLGVLALASAVTSCRPDDGTPQGLYRKHCARCHGLDGRGNRRAVKAKPGLDLTRSELAAERDREEIFRRIAEGEGTMPAFKDKLSREEIHALVDLSLELAGVPPYPPGDAPGGEPTAEPAGAGAESTPTTGREATPDAGSGADPEATNPAPEPT